MKKLTYEQIADAIDNTNSMQAAAKYLECSYSTFKAKAENHSLFKPNQAGRGISKASKYKSKEDVFKKDIFIGSYALRKWFLRDREYKCDYCGIAEWNDKTITLEIDHKNGNRLDNRECNLRLLCPNCHSQTDTFRSKNPHNYDRGCPTGGEKTYLRSGGGIR